MLSHISRSAPFLTCYYYIINYVFARVGRGLFQVSFQIPTLMTFPIRVQKLLLRRGHIHPTLFRKSRLKSDMEANQQFQQDDLIIIPPCVAAPKSDRGRVNQLVLRDDWSPSQSESYYPLLKPWLLVFDTQATAIPGTPQVWHVLSVLEHPVLQ